MVKALWRGSGGGGGQEAGERGREAGERGREAGERGREAGERGQEAGERGREAGAEIKKAIVCCLLLGIIQSKILILPHFRFQILHFVIAY